MRSNEDIACELVNLNARYSQGDVSAMEGMKALAWTAEVPLDFVMTLLAQAGGNGSVPSAPQQVIEIQQENEELKRKHAELVAGYAALERELEEKQKEVMQLTEELEEANTRADELERQLGETSGKVTELEAGLEKEKARNIKLERENAELNDLLAEPEKRISELEAENAELRAKAESFKGAVTRMKDGRAINPVLLAGREDDLYEDEAKEILMDVLKRAVGKMAKGSRRRDVIESIMDANPVDAVPEKNAEKIQRVMKGYRGLDTAVERALRETGISIEHGGGNHIRLTFMDDTRYKVTLSSSTSDKRAGDNAAADIIKQMF